MQQTTIHKARIITLLLCILALVSIAWVFLILMPSVKEQVLTADVYQNGSLIASIRLNEVEETYTFTVCSEDGGSNVVEVRQGAIRIVTADCPDLICVRQGFIKSTALPITCLPHRLVIQIREEDATWD